jgi:putative membrane protein
MTGPGEVPTRPKPPVPEPGPAPGEVPWQRLDARMIAVDVTRLAGSLVPLGIAVVLRNADAGAVASTLTTLALIGVAGAVFDLLRWASTWYRITDARVEVRTGLVTRRHRSIPRDRIRRVDATAKLLHRLFSLQVVTIATGDQSTSSDDELKLDAVTEPAAAEMRRRLLGSPLDDVRPDPGASETGVWVAGTPAPGSGEGEVLAAVNWRWAPYDLLSFWTLAIPALAMAGVLQVLQSVGITADEVVDGVADDTRLTGPFRDLSLAVGIALTLVAILVVGVVGALARFVETWWGFRLVREPGGRLRIRRGLLTTRSISLDEARLRGVEVTETVALRAAGGARLRAVTTGLAGADSSRGEGADVLLPPGPIGEARRVAAAVLAEEVSPTDRVDLRPHPPAARRRRLTRAIAAGAVAFALTAAAHLAIDGGAPSAAWVVPAAVTLVAVAYALDAYRSLGHGLAGRYLVVRRGSLARRTVALQRAGVIGWTVRRTILQRRVDLATIVVTTAAGNGSYAVADVAVGDGLRLADEAVPGLLAPFLTTAPEDPPPDPPHDPPQVFHDRSGRSSDRSCCGNPARS